MLIDAGANLNIQSVVGLTALMLASAEIARILIDAGADLNIQNFLGYTALMLISDSPFEDTFVWKSLKMLIDAGANLNNKNMFGKTALNLAYDKGLKETVRILAETQQNKMILF